MTEHHSTLTKIKAAIRYVGHSSRGKDFLLYIMCVCVAFIFWCVLSLDNETQRDFELPLELDGVPDSVVVITPVPSHINAVVSAKGSQILRFIWGTTPAMKLKFVEGTSNTFFLGPEKLDGRLREYFGHGVQIVSSRPDSIKLIYTTAPGHKVRLVPHLDVHPNLQYVINGSIRMSVDSVTLYSVTDAPLDLTQIETEPVVKKNLRDTTVLTVRVNTPPGVRAIPDKVRITIPVEPLISKRRQLPIETLNVPAGLGLITFPSMVDVSYLVPMSAYNNETPMKAFVDYNNIAPGSHHLKVQTSVLPEQYLNVTLSPDSVEYVIER